jgi:hypothetical protein
MPGAGWGRDLGTGPRTSRAPGLNARKSRQRRRARRASMSRSTGPSSSVSVVAARPTTRSPDRPRTQPCRPSDRSPRRQSFLRVAPLFLAESRKRFIAPREPLPRKRIGQITRVELCTSFCAPGRRWLCTYSPPLSAQVCAQVRPANAVSTLSTFREVQEGWCRRGCRPAGAHPHMRTGQRASQPRHAKGPASEYESFDGPFQ